jgi:hypothetical protein
LVRKGRKRVQGRTGLSLFDITKPSKVRSYKQQILVSFANVVSKRRMRHWSWRNNWDGGSTESAREALVRMVRVQGQNREMEMLNTHLDVESCLSLVCSHDDSIKGKLILSFFGQSKV